jgi:predicted SnoaL-like aldol condensation-catalyzing enzyme
MRNISLVFCMILMISCKTNSEKNNIKTDLKMTHSNKQLILDVYSKVFGQGDISFADSVVAEDYIQHNPMVKTGKAGFVEFLTMLKQMPKPDNPKKPFMRLICDNNLIAVHSQVEFMGKDNAVVDLYRIENGLLAEHWDAVQEIVDSVPNVVGTIELDNQEQTAVNQKTVKDFVKQVLVDKQTYKSINFLSENLSLSDFGLDYDNFKLHRLIGEHNFVLTQSEIEVKGTRFVQYDIYRLSNRLIVEHWTVKQIIPEKMAHSNGMI